MQTVDPVVSRRKFEREVQHLRSLGSMLEARGWWIMRADFPVVKVAFVTVNANLRVIPFAVNIDFTDYDTQPLAITFVDPFGDRELLPADMMTKLRRAMPIDSANPEGLAEPTALQVVELYQHYPDMPQAPGFLCVPGTRAYHAHPAHSGDPWEIHRTAGAGRLFSILETVWRYGTAPITAIVVNIALGASEIPA